MEWTMREQSWGSVIMGLKGNGMVKYELTMEDINVLYGCSKPHFGLKFSTKNTRYK